MDILLTSTAAWPFFKGIGLVGTTFSRKSLVDLYKDPKQRAAVEAILGRNGAMVTRAEREEASDILLGKKLDSSKHGCIDKAHNHGSGRHYKTDANEAAGLAMYTADDLLTKKNILIGCGFDIAEVTLLMRAGIAGSMGPTATVVLAAGQSDYIRKAAVKVLGRDLDKEKVHAVWEASQMSGAEKAAGHLKKAGFTDDEIKLIRLKMPQVSKDDIAEIKLNEDRSVANKPPPPAPAPAPVPIAAPQPAPIRAPAQAPIPAPVTPVYNNNPFNNPAYRGKLNDSSFDRTSFSDTEARSAVSNYAGIIKEPNGPARNFNAIIAMAKNTVAELQQAKKALASLKINYKNLTKADRDNIPVLEDTIARLERRCANIPYGAKQAGLGGPSIQSTLNEIIGGCN